MQFQGYPTAFRFLGVNQLGSQVAQFLFRFLERGLGLAALGFSFQGFQGKGNVMGQGFQQADFLIGEVPRFPRTWSKIQ